MMSISLIVIVAAAFFLWLFPGVAAADDTDVSSGSIRAFVSILPQAYFAERIAGDYAAISVLVGPGQSPATYDPSPKEIAQLSVADVYFRIGVPFETRLVSKINRMLPNLNIVETRADIELRRIESHIHDDNEHSHEQGAPDPHIWLDPSLVKTQAGTMCNELKHLDPGHAETFEKNLTVFHSELDSLDRAIDSILKPFAGMPMYVFHPSYGYFADRYGLAQVAVESEGKEPGAKQLTELMQQAKADGARAIFVQAQFATKTAEAIARELNIDVVRLDPLARDYMHNLMEMARRIAEGLISNSKKRGADDER
jgi:zinc transport system substrate-binding protein